ncbi:glycosyltransferase [Polynucleobacter nymphae]|uniref:glycosyltransferase n=1 Tax=Polynucleobacter nymphae TaxID=2081043 RepID=UPI001C0D7578|nr:glycosyltransferase [Polynucleobacter nymphae]MBU3607074.1 glycosyltransferase [Polynucleobacter nymphae]
MNMIGIKMKIAVITPYYQESIEVLRQCHQSVLTQNIAADHFFVADGFPNEELMKWNIKHISLPQAHADSGNTPRGIGSILADIEGYDFISYLDADNWFHPNHLSSLLNLYEETKADICTSIRTIHTNDGFELSVEESAEIQLDHVDTSCYLLHRNAFDALDIWLKMPKILSPVCDRIFLAGLLHKKYKIISTRQKTVAFRSQYKAHYLAANIEAPPGSKENVGQVPHEWLLTTTGMNEAVARLGFNPLYPNS